MPGPAAIAPAAPAATRPLPEGIPNAPATNLNEHIRLMLRNCSHELAKITQRRSQAEQAARARDPELQRLFVQSLEAQRQYEERLRATPEVLALEKEAEPLEKMQQGFLEQLNSLQKENER